MGAELADKDNHGPKRGSSRSCIWRRDLPEVEGPFLAEERDLINSLADSVSSYLDRKQAEAALRQTHERLQALSQRLMHVQEQERRHLSRDLHERSAKPSPRSR